MAKPKKPKTKRTSPPNGHKLVLVEDGEIRFEVEVLTLEEAAEVLRISPDALALDASSRRVPAFFVGGEWRFSKRALLSRLEVVRVLKSELGPPVASGSSVAPKLNGRAFFTVADLREETLPARVLKSMSASSQEPREIRAETLEEFEDFLEILRLQRDEVDRATKSGRYAEE